MRYTVSLPDQFYGGERMTLEIDDEGPVFSGDHMIFIRLIDVVAQPGFPIPPGAMSEPIDWTGPSGVLTALMAVDSRYDPGGSLNALLPDKIKKAKPRAIMWKGEVDPKARY